VVAGLTVPQLDALIKAATARKDEKLARARASFLDEIKVRAASLGMSLMDLVGQGPVKASKDQKKPQATGKSLSPKFRSPSGEIWSGRGRPARWLTQLEAKGHKRDEYAV
jgi:DNA-binding protein H-NS